MPRAYASTVIGAPAGTVWGVVRDFNALPDWHPGVTSSQIEDGLPSDQVGAIRDLRLPDGAQIRERLLELSDAAMTYSYNFETTPFDVQNYYATLRCTAITDGDRCFLEWWTTFDCDPAAIDEWLNTFANGVFKGGFDGLKERFG